VAFSMLVVKKIVIQVSLEDLNRRKHLGDSGG
jgi:hypothetical protein